MSISEAIAQYRLALKEGLKYYNAHVSAHENPYPEVLEDLMNETRTSGQTKVGTIEIPADQIVGTLAAGRKTAFAGNMMPILPEGSEFAGKWIAEGKGKRGNPEYPDRVLALRAERVLARS